MAACSPSKSLPKSLMSANISSNAKQVFEAAMAVLNGGERSPRIDSAQHFLRRQRALWTFGEGAELNMKRALAEAANALSALWHQSR